MAKPNINADLCTGCSLCVDDCAPQALEIQNDVARLSKPDECTGCGNCKDNCPSEAITLV
jgi:MinD superfamily P-loop ATPase